MLGLARRPKRKDPTPAQAYEALSQGLCLFSPISPCSGKARVTGLRDEQDTSDVLVCKAHYGRLRRLPDRNLDKLERHLTEAFAR